MVKEHIIYTASEWKDKKKRDLKIGFYLLIAIIIFIGIWFMYVNNLNNEMKEESIKYVEDNSLHQGVLCGMNSADVKLKLKNPANQDKTNEYYVYNYNEGLKVYFEINSYGNAGKVLFTEYNGEKSQTCSY